MFVGWMIGKEWEVDLGIWKSFEDGDLVIGLDREVWRVGYVLGVRDRERLCVKNGGKIREGLGEVL